MHATVKKITSRSMLVHYLLSSNTALNVVYEADRAVLRSPQHRFAAKENMDELI